MESHVGPFADGSGVIVMRTSDALFGPDGLGFSRTPWMLLVSWLARSGISEQTSSRPNETNVEGCVLGWGQGAFSSHVFQAHGGVDEAQLDRLIARLRHLARAVEGTPERITGATVAAYVGSRPPQPFRTFDGIREAKGMRERLSARFRGHIQWQSLVTLCGVVTRDGQKVVTEPLLRSFLAGEPWFFSSLVDRRRRLLAGQASPGERVGLLAQVGDEVDPVATDRALMKNKSSLWLVVKIACYMATRKGAGLGEGA